MRQNSLRLNCLFKIVSLVLCMLISSAELLAQSVIKGRVTDVQNGAPVAGATVTVKGTNISATTDEDGNYSINAPAGSTLVISSVGYGVREARVTAGGTANVSLTTATQGLTEVVVVGYGERSRRDVVGAISTVGARDIEKSTALSPELAMQGQMAGVQVVSGGSNPTARPTVRVRGVTSFNYADPLYVIDGVPFYEGGAEAGVDPVNDPTRRGPINILTIVNPNDIESISVLKDASAAAIYGVRAGNGVVLITTKRGKKGRVLVEFDAQYGVQKVPKKFDVLNTQQYVDFYTQAYNANPDLDNNVPIPIGEADDFSPLWDPANPGYIRNRSTYDWQGAAINDESRIENYNLRASGGSDNFTYNFGLGYANNDGPFIGYNAKRYSISTNLVARISKFVEAGLNIRGVQQDTKNPDDIVSMSIYRAAPWQEIYDPNGPYGYGPLWNLTGPLEPGSFPIESKYGQQYVASGNFLGQLATQERTNQNQTGLGTAYLQITPINGLKIKGTYSAQQSQIRTRNYRNFDNWWFGENPESPYPSIDDFPAGTRPGALGIGNSTSLSITKSINADYTKSFGNHNVNVTLDASRQEMKWTGNGSESIIFTDNPDLRYYSVSPTPIFRQSGYNQLFGAYILHGLLGRVSYNFAQTYYVEAVIRRDGSSKLAPGRRYESFPAFSAGWRISNEKFMQEARFITDLKIRGSYGTLGNVGGTPGWKYLSAAGVVPPSYNLGNNPANNSGIAYVNFPNRDLTWEKIKSLNIGFDAALFDNAVNVSFDYYRRQTDGIIQSVQLPPTTGVQTRADLNIADVLNSGIELQVGYQKTFGEVAFNASANFTTTNNEVTGLFRNQAIRNSGLEIGMPIGYIYGYRVGGIFQNQAEIDKYADEVDDRVSAEQAPGDLYFQNLFGAPLPGTTDKNPDVDSVINENDQTMIGKTIPGYFYGFNFGANWRGFDFGVFFQGRGDVQRVNQARIDGEGMNGYGRNVLSSVLDAWTPTNSGSSMPRAVYGDPNGNTRFSDRWVEDAGYLRLQNVTIGYTIPRSLISKTGGAISNLRLYVTGINLFTITPYSGLDPENDYFPATRQFLFGIRAAF
jgi:TonB-dependent starch-binding outer membrane protein SusC